MFRRLAVNKYYKNLYPLLRKRYGGSESFTSGQIIRTIEDCGLSKRYTSYALALFLEKSALMDYLNESGSKLDPIELRQYIAKRFFGGNEDYSYQEAQSFIVGNSGYSSVSHFEASRSD